MRNASLQSGPPAQVWLRRALLLVLAGGSLYVASLNARWLLAEAYSIYARETLRRDSPDEAAAAAALALRLEPWNVRYQGQLARAERRRGDGEAAERLYLLALRRAPADAELWRDYALLQVSRRQYDARIEHAVARAQALSPTHRGLHLALGLTGLSTWSAARPALQRLWSRSVNFRLRHGRKEFLRYVFASESESTLCRNFGSVDAAMKDWCYWAPNARRTCYLPGLPPKQQRACERLGAYLGRTS